MRGGVAALAFWGPGLWQWEEAAFLVKSTVLTQQAVLAVCPVSEGHVAHCCGDGCALPLLGSCDRNRTLACSMRVPPL